MSDIYVPCVHNPTIKKKKNARKILRTLLKKGNVCLGKQILEIARLVLMKETTEGMNIGYTRDGH